MNMNVNMHEHERARTVRVPDIAVGTSQKKEEKYYDGCEFRDRHRLGSIVQSYCGNDLCGTNCMHAVKHLR